MADKTEIKKLTVLQRIKKLERLNADLTTRIDRLESNQQEVEDEWTLDSDQMIFMLQYHNAIDAAYEDDNMEFLRELADTDEYMSVFGDMSFDEAYDRYECMFEDRSADS